VFAIDRRFEAYSSTVSTVVLAAVAVSEVIGPLGARFALIRSGEAGRATPADPMLMDLR
jgi:hypothetical protein